MARRSAVVFRHRSHCEVHTFYEQATRYSEQLRSEEKQTVIQATHETNAAPLSVPAQ